VIQVVAACIATSETVSAFQRPSQSFLSRHSRSVLARAGSDERTFIMVKPDGVVRGLCGRILSRFEEKGLTLVGTKFTKAAPATLNEHYAHIADKPFYPDVFEYMTSAPVLQMVFQGENAVSAGRILLGATDPMKADLGSIRADFGLSVDANLCHGSDSVESAEKEIDLWFNGKSEADGADTSAAGGEGSLERTYIMVKPDGVRRGLCGRIVSKFEDKGLRLVASRHGMVDKAVLDEHYAHITDKPFYPEVSEYMTSGPVLMMAFQGLNAVKAGKTLLGATNPMEAALGSLRGDFGLSVAENICHGSLTVEEAQTEMSLWLEGKTPIVSWAPP